MSTWWSLILLLATTLLGVLVPMFRRRHDKSLNRGIETDELADLWVREKDRLAGERRDLDLALVAGEIDEKKHREDQVLLNNDARRALQRLRSARASSADPPTRRNPRTYVSAGLATAACVAGLTAAVTILLADRDLQRDVAPHPVPRDTENARKETGDGGVPDIAEMVAGLETRVLQEGSKASTEDLLMLAKSYQVTNRERKAIALYERVLDREKANRRAVIALGRIYLQSKSNADLNKAETLIARILQNAPDLPEGLWLKSLLLLKNHKMIEAEEVLKRLRPMVEDNPAAQTAVANLLQKLQSISTMPATRSQ